MEEIKPAGFEIYRSRTKMFTWVYFELSEPSVCRTFSSSSFICITWGTEKRKQAESEGTGNTNVGLFSAGYLNMGKSLVHSAGGAFPDASQALSPGLRRS